MTKGAIIEEFISSSSNLPLWAPVVLAAPGTNETMPRVTTTTTANDATIIGITCGPKRASGYCADNAGDSVMVCTFGATKAKIIAASVSRGTILVSTTTAGSAGAASAGNKNGFAMALFAGSTDGDIIPVYVKGATTG